MTLAGEAASLLPADDGSQLVLVYGSEIVGSPDGCGCMGNPRVGGLPYRLAYTEGIRAATPDVGVLQLDAGSSLTSVSNAEGHEVADFVAQDEGTVTALDRLAFDAANISDHDIPFLARYLRAGSWERAVAERPVLGRYVSANVEPALPGLVAPSAYIVRTIAAPRLAAGSARVAIAGVTEANPALERTTGFRITDAAAALARVLPRARSESDLVVVLAYMPARQAAELATAIGSLADVIIVANSISGDVAPSLDGTPRVTYAWYKTQNLGVLRLRFDGTRLAAAANAYVKMDEPLPRDPLAEELVAAEKRAVRAAKERRFAEEVGGTSGASAP